MFATFVKFCLYTFFQVSSSSVADYALPKQLGFQPAASPIMAGIVDLHHFVMFYIVFILAFVFCMIYFILETSTIHVFQKREFEIFSKLNVLYNIKFSHHTLLEILWVIIPSIILASIAYPSFVILYSMEYFVDSLVNLKVIGHQWYWSYELMHGIVTNNDGHEFIYKKVFDSYMVETEDLKKYELRLLETTAPIILPIKTYIRVLITADDVLHCWAIPSLGVKLDAVPGRLNETFIYINRIGHFYGQCSEICGVKHAFMPIEIYAIKIKTFKEYCENFCDKYNLSIISESETNEIFVASGNSEDSEIANTGNESIASVVSGNSEDSEIVNTGNESIACEVSGNSEDSEIVNTGNESIASEVATQSTDTSITIK